MVYTLFFSRLREFSGEEQDAYRRHAQAVQEVAVAEHSGFVSLKTYVSEDGERLSVVVFRDAESQRGWKLDPLHREAQARGRSDYYESYRIVVCEERHVHGWVRR